MWRDTKGQTTRWAGRGFATSASTSGLDNAAKSP